MKRDIATSIQRIGILADTHLGCLTKDFQDRVDVCFQGVDMILHAGDLTSPTILAAFAGMEVHAVHGNMCDFSSCASLPEKKIITVGCYRIGLIHKAGCGGYDFEDLLFHEFDDVDCVVFGHTHSPQCRLVGGVLLLNPGSFTATGRFGAPGTFAVLEVGNGLHGKIYQVPPICSEAKPACQFP